MFAGKIRCSKPAAGRAGLFRVLIILIHILCVLSAGWSVIHTRLAWSRELELREGRRVCVCAVPAQHRGPQRAVRGVGLAARGGDV